MSRSQKNIISLVMILVLAFVAYELSRGSDGSTLADKALTEFSVQDTASIGAFSVEDALGRKVVISRRADGFWDLNDRYIAMPHMVDLILRTFKNVGIQNPVPEAQRETAMRILLGDTRKVKILDRDSEWIKTWHVGRATQNNQGTFALLETPEDGISTDPFIIEYRGFRGYLTTRFHAREIDWRWTGVFHYPELEINTIDVQTPRDPSRGFRIGIQSVLDGEFQLMDHSGAPIPMDKGAVLDYIQQFKSVNLEHFQPDIKEYQADSILALPPDIRFTVTDNRGVATSCDLYFRATPQVLRNRMTNPPAIDPERVFINLNGDLAYGQRLTFDRIIATVDDLRTEELESR